MINNTRFVLLSIRAVMLSLLCFATVCTVPAQTSQHVDSTDTVKNAEPEFILLNSVLGYDLNATKRALIRTVEPIDPEILDTRRTTWCLRGNNQKEVMTGSLKYLGPTFGVQLWEIDFSELQEPGMFQITVDLRDRKGETLDELSTLPFEVSRGLHINRTFKEISINNAEARRAPAERGGGYHDCNAYISEAGPMSAFGVGLMKAYMMRGKELSAEDRERLLEAIAINMDYLFTLQTPSGRILGNSPKQAEYHPKLKMTQMGLYALATYANFFKEIDPERAEQAYRNALKSAEYLSSNGDRWGIRLKVPVYFNLYKYSGDETYKDKTISTLNHELETLDLFDMSRTMPLCIFPIFEGLYYCVEDFKDHPDHKKWIEKAKQINEQYFQRMIRGSGFQVTTFVSGWENMEGLAADGYVRARFWGCNFAVMAIDAMYLSHITGDKSLEKIATGSLSWITGLHVGLVGEDVTNPPTEKSLVSASFIWNSDTRHAKPWSRWWWTPTENMQTIINGFSIEEEQFIYVDDWGAGETWIQHDGTYLYAICLYDDYLNNNKERLSHK